ncbi:YafY family transcriptional regulator [Clostridium sp. YIM B02515]|uniref:YafY family transcriptional regulator n=1 Tax=Clostridium rhizosphaerae TaxID=2803861 RepID=A0ABS1T4E8_9CLOT|nr:YafY family protein [Clostridium rhizosphaerae]MBL4934203.1 YafY family transcriptional regulator [Clostridium rhizosphaerae]
MKIERLISIVMVLLERRKISAVKLAEMFEVTPRTIYRDIETLNLAGIPIISYPGVNGGVGIMEEYKIDKKLFTTSDVATLLMGLGSISSTISNDEITNTLAKVKGMIPAEQVREIELKSNQITIDLSPWIGNKNLQPNLEKIKTALNDKKLLSFNYSDRNNNKTNRKVEPYRLVLKESNWYLQGYCDSRQDFRIFKLSRIGGLQVLEDAFTPRELSDLVLGAWEHVEKRISSIKLLVHESLRDRIIEYCEEENIEVYGDNKLLVSFPFVADDFGYSLLLSFGDKCECLEPANVREELIRRTESMLKIYSSHNV